MKTRRFQILTVILGCVTLNGTRNALPFIYFTHSFRVAIDLYIFVYGTSTMSDENRLNENQ